MCPSDVSNLGMLLLKQLWVSKQQKYLVGVSPSNKLVARDLMTAPFTLFFYSVNSKFSFLSSCKLSSFKFCSNLRIFAASCVSFLSLCFFLRDE